MEPRKSIQPRAINWEIMPDTGNPRWLDVTSNRKSLSNVLFASTFSSATITQFIAKPILSIRTFRSFTLFTLALFISGIILRCLPTSKRCPEWVKQQRESAENEFRENIPKFDEIQYDSSILSPEEIQILLQRDICKMTYGTFINKHKIPVLDFLDQTNKELLKPKYLNWLVENHNSRGAKEIANDEPSKKLKVCKDEIATWMRGGWITPGFEQQFALFAENQEEQATAWALDSNEQASNEALNIDLSFMEGYRFQHGIGPFYDMTFSIDRYRHTYYEGHSLAKSHLSLLFKLSHYFNDRLIKLKTASLFNICLEELESNDLQLALRFYSILAEKSDPIAQYYLGMIYEKELIPESYAGENAEKADEFYTRASQQGYLMAIIRKEYKKAKQGDKDAQYRCGRSLLQLSRRELPNDADTVDLLHDLKYDDLEKMGVAFLKKIENPKAYYELGFHYLMLGTSVTWDTRYPNDYEENTRYSSHKDNLARSSTYLLKAAKENHPLAQSALGLLFKAFPTFWSTIIPQDLHETCKAYDPTLATQEFLDLMVHNESRLKVGYYLTGPHRSIIGKIENRQILGHLSNSTSRWSYSGSVKFSPDEVNDPLLSELQMTGETPSHCMNSKDPTNAFLRYIERLEIPDSIL